MNNPFKPTPPDASAVCLRVVKGADQCERQFWIENGPGSLGGEFDKYYVNFSGFFGAHNPWVFAAAPEMFKALQAICAEAENMSMTMRRRALFNAGNAAISKALGTPPNTMPGDER